MGKHTPGPWRPGHIDHWERGEKIAVRAENIDNQPYVAFLPDLDGNVLANACLVAAAPDLLAACKRMIKHIDHVWDDDDLMECRDELIAAVAKAEGARP